MGTGSSVPARQGRGRSGRQRSQGSREDTGSCSTSREAVIASRRTSRARDLKTFRLGILADIHADAPALRDALARIKDLGCDQIVCAGDIVDFGVYPEETISIIRELKIPCITGNHDRGATKEGSDTTGWDLTSRAITFLESLPRQWSATLAGVRVSMWHARPGSDMDGIYADASRADLEAMLDKAGADVLVVAHTHLPVCLTVSGRGMIVNPGAVLRDPAVPLEEGAMVLDPVTGKWTPAPTSCGGTLGVLELPERKFTVHRAADGVEVEIVRRTVGWLRKR